MVIKLAIETFCEMLRDNIEGEIILGRPDDMMLGVYVWPWRLTEDPNFRNRLEPTIEKTITSSEQGIIINIIIFVTPAITTEGISKLEKIRQVILKKPVLNIEGTTIRIIPSFLSSEDLTNILSAAYIPLRICLGVELRM